MSDKIEDLLHEFRKFIESEVTHQVHWHVQHGSTADRTRLVDIARQHVAEKLDKIAEKLEADGKDEMAEFVYLIKEDYLPHLLHEMRHNS